MRLLPATQMRVLQVVVVLLCAAFMAFGVQALRGQLQRVQGLPVLGIGLFGACAVLSYNLWRLDEIARVIAKAVLGMGVVLVIAGIFNPFYAMDYGHQHGGREPDWWGIVLWLAPWIGAALFCFWALDNYRGEFRKSP